MNAEDIKKLVDDPVWQALRKSFLNTWRSQPEKNIKALRDYLGNMEDKRKLRRVLNYLTGTGFRTKTISHPSINHLLSEVRVAMRNKEQVEAISDTLEEELARTQTSLFFRSGVIVENILARGRIDMEAFEILLVWGDIIQESIMKVMCKYSQEITEARENEAPHYGRDQIVKAFTLLQQQHKNLDNLKGKAKASASRVLKKDVYKLVDEVTRSATTSAILGATKRSRFISGVRWSCRLELSSCFRCMSLDGTIFWKK